MSSRPPSATRCRTLDESGIEYGADVRYSARPDQTRPARTSIYEAFVGQRFRGRHRQGARRVHLAERSRIARFVRRRHVRAPAVAPPARRRPLPGRRVRRPGAEGARDGLRAEHQEGRRLRRLRRTRCPASCAGIRDDPQRLDYGTIRRHDDQLPAGGPALVRLPGRRSGPAAASGPGAPGPDLLLRDRACTRRKPRGRPGQLQPGPIDRHENPERGRDCRPADLADCGRRPVCTSRSAAA